MKLSYLNTEIKDCFAPLAIKIWARSSVVEHLPFKQRVGGSRPPGLTKSRQVGIVSIGIS